MAKDDGNAKSTLCLFKPRQAPEPSIEDITLSFTQAGECAEQADASQLVKSLSKFGILVATLTNPNAAQPTQQATKPTRVTTPEVQLSVVKGPKAN